MFIQKGILHVHCLNIHQIFSSDDLVYVFYLGILFFALCSIVMLPIPVIARRNKKIEKEKQIVSNRDDVALRIGLTKAETIEIAGDITQVFSLDFAPGLFKIIKPS